MKKQFFKLLKQCFLTGLFLVLLSMQSAMAQQTVTGTVTDETGGPVPGANIVVQGTTDGTQTDFDGNFTIDVSSNAVLVFSYLGYATQNVTVGNQTTINVQLAEDASQLDEVIVIGYGTAKKSDLTGAVSRVTTEAFEDQPVTRVEEALQGRAAGVTVARANGQPGGAIKVRIRGVNSIEGDNSPLVVIDGIQGADLTTINPNDIATMDILKDASATAIYGVRGSNGVIIITTKRGSGKGRINVDFFTTISSVPRFLPTLADNPDEFARIENLRRTQTGGSPIFSDAEISNLAANGGTNYQDELLRTGISENLQISASGSEGKLSYFLSGNYRDEEGVVINTGLQQLSVRSNIDAQVTDKLKVGVNIFAVRGELKNNVQRFGNGQGSFIYKALTWDPTTPVFDADGNYNIRSLKGIASLNDNPVRTLNDTDIRDINERLNGVLNVKYDITDNFSYSMTLGSQVNNFNIQRYAVEVGDDQLPHTSFENNKFTSFQLTNILTWQKEFGKHDIKLTGVQEYTNAKRVVNGYDANDLSLDGKNFYFAELAPNSGQTVNNRLEPRELSSFMLRAEYILDNNLFLTATGRYDASSVFREENRWGFFPSVALAYSFNDMLGESEAISSLKLRAGWGQVGNQNVDPFDTFTTPAFNSYAFDGSSATAGTRLNRIGNPDLTWETTSQFNVGVDLGFNNGRGNITVEGYQKTTTDILLPVALPDTFGGNNSQITVRRNVGEMENIGVDFTIGYDILSTENLNWNSNLALSYVKNEVTSLYDGLERIEGRFTAPGGQGNILNGIEVGQPIGQFFGATFLGTWKTTDDIPLNSEGNPVAVPGDAKYLLDEDNQILFGAIGNGTPDFTWGWNNSVNYKNWDLNVFVQGQHGFDVYNVQQGGITGGAGDSRSFLASDQVNAWTPTNETDIPAFAHLYESSRYVEKGDFIRLTNLALGYTIQDVAGLEGTSLKIYASGQNLFLITDYSGYDPESTSRRTNNQGNEDAAAGINIGAYPNPRTLSIGLKVGF
ncbi:SusC/RagA family TonB-linked outer membrane protein [Maribacter sp. 2307UL18-2]|uniref:SusC/RagA family TonB-linked outer membrane protein n=1 Tax=Maribacter sp. 2307UL18-2 TaxID=3386274 RepID=UPI0039BCA8CB